MSAPQRGAARAAAPAGRDEAAGLFRGIMYAAAVCVPVEALVWVCGRIGGVW